MNPLLEAALSYANRGWHVFPCAPGTKKPLEGSNGFKDATTDPEIIRTWWKEIPDANVALATEASGLAIVDLDEWTGLEEWEELIAGRDAISTFSITTPRGGLHLYFRGDLPPTQHKLGSKIDTRGRGSYVLVPPSQTDAGPYRVERDLPLASLPTWIPDHLASLKTVAARHDVSGVELDLPWNIERAVRRLKDVGTVIEGQGSDSKTVAIACEMRDLGLSAEQAVETMLAHYDCQPLTEDWLREKIQNAYRYAENAMGVDALSARPSSTFAMEANAILATLPPPKRDRFQPYSEAEMDNLPEPTWLIPNLLPDAETAILYGPSGSFKSFIALDLALSVAAGVTTFAGQPTRSGLVFYVALEGKHNLMTVRRKAWRQANQIESVPNFFVMNGPTMGEDIAAREEFCDSLASAAKSHPIAMIVIDTGAKMMAGTNENDARDAGMFVGFCDHLRETFQCGVLAVLHAGKETDRGIRGSSAIYAGFDTVMAVETQREKFVTSLKVEKHKDAEERSVPWHLRLVKVGGSLVPVEIQTKEFRELTEGHNPLSELNVARKLQLLGAGVSGKPGLTTHAFVSCLFPLGAEQSVDDNERQKRAAVLALNKLAKDRLAAYCEITPLGPLWRTLD